MKKLKTLLGVITCMLFIFASGSVYASEAPPTVSPTPSPTVVSRKGLVEEGNKLCYYFKGNKIKNKWKVIDGDHYYFDSNGYAVTGGVIFKNNVVYVFGKDHKRLENRAGKIVTIGKYSYCLTTKDGKAATGYFIRKNHLYYANSKGRIYKKRYREKKKYYFTSSGAAKETTDALLKIRSMQIVSSITNSKMTKSQKLYVCWRYVVGGNIRYWSHYPNLGQKNWQRSMALYTLQNRGGNCYGFACAFAALAKEIGYEPYIIYGYVPGSRDGRSDGMTRHCWVQISGLSYDPEATYAGWASGIYGTYGYGVYHWTSGSVKFG